MKTIYELALRCILIFVLLFIISVPFEYYYFPNLGLLTSGFFELITQWIGDNYFEENKKYTHEIISDSIGMYIHVLVLAAISFFAGIASLLINIQTATKEKINYWFGVAASCFLSLQLFKYGFDKVFKHQFYLPEPNTVYTPLGYLSPDILYWSTIGSSHLYSVFCGVIEIIPAALLLFKRTRSLGAIIAMFVLLNVVMINLGFDISVKIFSCFLLLLSILIAAPSLKAIYKIFVLQCAVNTLQWQPAIEIKSKQILFGLTKVVVITAILFESTFIYFKAKNFNDDKAQRPYLHGAYSVDLFIRNGDTIPPLLTDVGRLKKIFIHRQGYFITQNMNDEMSDYQLNYDYTNKKLILMGYDKTKIIFDYNYSEKDSVLKLSTLVNHDTIKIETKKIDLKSLPLFQNNIHWTIDDYN